MMDLLGIKELRPGRSGTAGSPNYANYDESKANPYPDLPDPLVSKNGKRVKDAKTWWNKRRPEIVEDFDREIYGRMPKITPKVTWEVTSTTKETNGDVPIITKKLVGHVDNPSDPSITVDIQVNLSTPADAKGPVPVIMEFGFIGPFPGGPFPGRGRAGAAGPPPGPTWQQQVLAKGWGYAVISPNSVQADNGAGLTSGIIGLVNKGQPRKADDWGALRAWAWGASRALDYFETDKSVDAKQVGLEGHSRYGKATIVAMAYDARFAIAYVSSSGEGGAKLHRRDWGEIVENVAGSGEYHWMAGNFIKYAGPLHWNDLPVDSHELVALCAPRPVFISGGATQGDGWVDAKGSFLAAAAAGPVYKLLGKKDLGTAEFPPMETPLIDGDIAFRQHSGGHTPGPNWPTFLTFASRYIHGPPVAAVALAARAAAQQPADHPVPRSDQNSMTAHEQLLEKAKQGRIDVYFEGDSITRRWAATDYPEMLANWKQNFFGWNAADFGWGADLVQNVLWRLNHGEIDGVNPKVIVLLAGTNNVGNRMPEDEEARATDVTRGIQAVLQTLQAKAPRATIVLMAIFPRNDNIAVMPTIDKINGKLARLADGRRIRYLNINAMLADRSGKLFDGMMVDQLHPTVKGYQVWADALKPILTELLGPPAAEDHAPPPTGDPSAAQRTRIVPL